MTGIYAVGIGGGWSVLHGACMPDIGPGGPDQDDFEENWIADALEVEPLAPLLDELCDICMLPVRVGKGGR